MNNKYYYRLLSCVILLALAALPATALQVEMAKISPIKEDVRLINHSNDANANLYNTEKDSKLMETIQGRTVAIVTFPVSQEIGANAMRELLETAGPAYTNIPGLLRKYFIFKEGVGGGIYEWASKSQAEAFYNEQWYARIQQQSGSKPDVQIFASPAIADGVKHKLDIFMP